MTPYKHHQTLNHSEKQYNKVQSSTRMPIERAFGKLKGRWLILQTGLNCGTLQRSCDIILVCCALHNICIDNGDLWQHIYIDPEDNDDDNNNDGNDYQNSNRNQQYSHKRDTSGKELRSRITDYLITM